MNSSDLYPGDLVSVRFSGVLRHYGVVTYGGRILSNNGMRGGVISQTYSEFAQGRPVKRHSGTRSENSYGAHHRAYGMIGNDYSLTGSNCVHFARRAQGKRPTSTQYARATYEAIKDLLGSKRRY